MRLVELLVSILILGTAQMGFVSTVRQAGLTFAMVEKGMKRINSVEQSLEGIKQEFILKGEVAGCQTIAKQTFRSCLSCQINKAGQVEGKVAETRTLCLPAE